MRILAIDPGTYQSGWVLYDTVTRKPTTFGIDKNTELRHLLGSIETADRLAIEMVQNYGRIVGRDVFETAVWVGRFIEAWLTRCPTLGDHSMFYVYRHEVRLEMLNSASGKGEQIKKAIEDRYGGKLKAVGAVRCPKCKGKGWFGAGRPVCPKCDGSKWLHPPGPLHGIKDHAMSALGVALTFAAREKL